MRKPVSITMDQRLFDVIYTHLFPGDHDEHGAVIAAGIVETERGTRLLAREAFLARDGVEYVPGTRGYRALTARFVAETSGYCESQNLCYLSVHCHGGRDTVEFSNDDLASHERGYPALLDITRGGPVGALVFAENAVAGEVWTPSGRCRLDELVVLGNSIRRLYPGPRNGKVFTSSRYDRQSRLFGDVGQTILNGLKVGIIGLGGGGSLINQWLAHLGVGHIVALDFDRVDITNLPRIVGATQWDARSLLTASRSQLLQRIGKRLATHKVKVASRVAKRANPNIRYEAIVGDILDAETAARLRDADFIFLASDSIQSRLVFNALVQQYLIPGVQIGAKVPWDPRQKTITNVFAATRPVMPGPGHGCLECNDLIPPSKLREESLAPAERRRQRYMDDPEITEPSVIALNVLSAGQALSDFMLMFTGLFEPEVELRYQLNFVRERHLCEVESRSKANCPDCSNTLNSRRARGDRARLPCRAERKEEKSKAA